MTRAEVDAVLGAPVFLHATNLPPQVGDEKAWYLPPPAIDDLTAPWGPGTICVRYAPDGRVTAKSFNPQAR